jgi:hypothetical protein
MTSIPTVNTFAVFIDAKTLLMQPPFSQVACESLRLDFLMDLINAIHEKFIPKMSSMVMTTVYGKFAPDVVARFNEKNMVVKDYDSAKKGIDVLLTIGAVINNYIFLTNESWIDLVTKFLDDKKKTSTFIKSMKSNDINDSSIVAESLLSKETLHKIFTAVEQPTHYSLEDSVIGIIRDMVDKFHTEEIYLVPLMTAIAKKHDMRKSDIDHLIKQLIRDNVIYAYTDDAKRVTIVLNHKNELVNKANNANKSHTPKLTDDFIKDAFRSCFKDNTGWQYASSLGATFKKQYPEINFGEVKQIAIDKKIIEDDGAKDKLKLRMTNGGGVRNGGGARPHNPPAEL